MKENIETKDVQRTEYLDKNGLDMLWAKVKENTRNQVEVEYNRAKAKEDSLSQEIASVKPDEGKSYIQAKLTDKEQDVDRCYYDVAGSISFKSEYSDSYGGPITIIDKNGIGINFDNDATFGSSGSLKVKKDSNYNITMQGNGRLLHDTRDTFNQVSIQLLDNVDTTYANSSGGNSILISQLGIFYTSQGYALTSNDLLTGHGGYKTIGTDITPLENGKVPAEYLDLSQYAKKSEITAGGNVDDVQVNGVSVVENKIANIKPATKESLGVVKVGDGLNVADGTISVDSTAIGAGNYIPYEDFTDGIGYWFPYKQNLFINREKYGGTGTSISPGRIVASDNNYSVYVGQNTTGLGVSVDHDNKIRSILTMDNLEIYHYINNERYIGVRLNKEGISLLDGDNNHVLTSHGSTIDITQYAKKIDLPTVPTKVSQLQNDSEFIAKSAYDEKIAALEARIAALEAKHTETA